MFVGEFSCWVVFKILQAGICLSAAERERKRTEEPPAQFNPLIFLVPACCDICGTSMMYIGLTLTFASSFQMLRAAVIIFTGFVSMIFLGKRLKVSWSGFAPDAKTIQKKWRLCQATLILAWYTLCANPVSYQYQEWEEVIRAKDSRGSTLWVCCLTQINLVFCDTIIMLFCGAVHVCIWLLLAVLESNPRLLKLIVYVLAEKYFWRTFEDFSCSIIARALLVVTRLE